MSEAINLDELERAAKAVSGWGVTYAWPTDEDGVWEVGHEDEDGNRYEIVEVDTANYFQPAAAEPLARFIAAANPEVVAALIARVREAEEREQALARAVMTDQVYHDSLAEQVKEQEAKLNALLAHCPDGECPTCSKIICPHDCDMHFHHDGCPACAEHEEKGT